MRTFIFGAGGHGKVVLDILTAQRVSVDGFLDDRAQVPPIFGVPVLNENTLRDQTEFQIVVALGTNHIRRDVVRRLKTSYPGAVFVNAIHPTAYVSPLADLGTGNVIAAGAIVGASATLGDHIVINTGAQVDHDCVINDFASVAPGSILGGAVTVGEGAYIGIGSTVRHGLKIGEWSVLGAGSVATGEVPDHVIAYGVPSKVIRTRKENEPYL